MNSETNPSSSVQGELTDQAIQGLYAIGLKLEYCIALVDESPAQVRIALDSAITELGELIDTLRTHMQSLHRNA